jgi:hypothetical protein
MADWRDSKGVRHRAAFPTAAEAEAHQQRMRQAADRSCQLPRQGRDGDNRSMNANAAGASATGEDSRSAETASPGIPFVRGSMVVVTLGNPRDKFWGMILSLAPEGLSISGAELASFEDLVVMVKDGDSFTPAVVFFPMHRIERLELDLPDGSLPSLSQRFSAKTGRTPQSALGGFPAIRTSQDYIVDPQPAIVPKKDKA